MPRITPRSAPYPPEIQAHFDAVMPPGRPPLVLFTILATSDRAWRKFRAGSLLDGRLLSLRQRELVVNRVCARADCEYEWGVHVTAFGAAAELCAADIAATRARGLDVGRWSPDEAALLTAIDALHDRATLSDDEFAELKAHFSDDQILEIFMLAGFYRTVAYIANGLDLPLEPAAARFSDFAS